MCVCDLVITVLPERFSQALNVARLQHLPPPFVHCECQISVYFRVLALVDALGIPIDIPRTFQHC